MASAYNCSMKLQDCCGMAIKPLFQHISIDNVVVQVDSHGRV